MIFERGRVGGSPGILSNNIDAFMFIICQSLRSCACIDNEQAKRAETTCSAKLIYVWLGAEMITLHMRHRLPSPLP